jgi:hypothetical protein
MRSQQGKHYSLIDAAVVIVLFFRAVNQEKT